MVIVREMRGRKMPKKITPHTSEALSIIEVLVSGALIGSVLTALAVNMIYTQRMVEEIKSRSKAVDQAYSCLAKFRAMRDMKANTWPYFCGKMVTFADTSLTDKSEIKFFGSYYEDASRTHKSASSQEVTVCDEIAPNTYSVVFLGRDGSTKLTDGEAVKGACKELTGPEAKRGAEGFYVRVIVKYKDAVGKDRTVSVQEKFMRGGVDAEYCPSGSC